MRGGGGGASFGKEGGLCTREGRGGEVHLVRTRRKKRVNFSVNLPVCKFSKTRYDLIG